MKQPFRTPSATVRVLALAAGACLALAASAAASIHFEPWAESSFQEAVDRAAAERKLVMLVVTQPDWCPPCIRLNASWLSNPADTVVAELAADLVSLEVLGYDAPGAALLRQQEVRFQGTPSVLVYRPVRAGLPLGQAPLLGSIVGAPEDFPDRLKAIVSGHDPVAEVEARLRLARDPLARAQLLHELGDLLVARGKAEEAVEAYGGVRRLRREALGAEERVELAALVDDADWKRAASVELRVNKDYERALAGIDAYLHRWGREARDAGTVGYARAWALAHLGRTAEALREMETTVLSPGDVEGVETFAYFCFRVEEPGLLAEGERRTRAALREHPERAGLEGALGRILRRQGRLEEAASAFRRAVEAASGPDQAGDRLVWQGHLDHCRGELARGAAAS